jgi:hypothetical protein
MIRKALILGSAMLLGSAGLAVAQTATPSCVGSQNTNCIPGGGLTSGGMNGTTGSTGTMQNGMTGTLPGQTPNGLRTAPGNTGLGTGTGLGVGSTGTGLGSSAPGTGSTGTGLGTGMGATPGVGGASSGVK